MLRSRLEVVESVAEIGGQFHFGPTKTYQLTLDRYGHLFPYEFDELAEHLNEARQQILVDS